ncbi:MAG: anaerobic sulfatase maturase [Thermotogota bacterium]
MRLLLQTKHLMSDDVLEAYIRETLHVNGKNAVVEFQWHGGEPLLAGKDFFKKAVELEVKYGKGRKILNTLQTNATLIDEDWCRFFANNNLLLGVSIDGPEELHNVYRKGTEGDSFKRVMTGIEQLKRFHVRFNILTTVNAANEDYPEEVYDFLREHTDYMQFLPVVERKPDFLEVDDGQQFATPPGVKSPLMPHAMMPFSVSPEGYGHFMSAIFQRWQKKDKGRKYVQLIEVTIGNRKGIPSSLCIHNPLCGHAASVEVDGNCYSCDHYAFPEYQLGNILETPLDIMMEKNRAFGMQKTYGLSKECFECPYLKLCFGGCPKDRFLISQNDGKEKNFLCEGYKIFFNDFLTSSSYST